MYEAHCGASQYANHGERVVVGKRLIQSATDIFVGWTRSRGNEYYVRQFRDMKVIPDGALIAPRLAEFARSCGAVLARAHARTGDALAIDAYIGKGGRFDDALGNSPASTPIRPSGTTGNWPARWRTARSRVRPAGRPVEVPW